MASERSINALRLGIRVRPRSGTNLTTHSHGSIWGWGRGSGTIEELRDDAVVVRIQASRCPSGWAYYEGAKHDTVPVAVSWEDSRKLVAA